MRAVRQGELKPEEPIMVEWIGTEDVSIKNPNSIENFLKSKILSAQVTLLGELDLNQPANYGGNNWTILELADYLVSKPVIKSQIAHSTTPTTFPAAIAIWGVSQAQNSQDGTKLWTNLEEYSQPHQANFAKIFSDAIALLGLETFENELLGAQRHLMLARIHAMIPNFAVEKYALLIKRAVKYHLPIENIFNDIQSAPDISEGVKKLFAAKPEIGIDLIKRSLQSAMYGGHFGLPTRLIDQFTATNSSKSKTKLFSTPIVIFNESFCEFELWGTSGWSVLVEGGSDYISGALPPGNVSVSRDRNEPFQILNFKKGFLVFDEEGRQIEGTKLPKGSGYLAWNEDVEVLNEEITNQAWPIHSWPNWKYSYFEDLKSLIIKDHKGVMHGFNSSKSLDIRSNTVPFLIYGDNRLPVFDSWPVLQENQVTRLTDNNNGETYELAIEGGPLDLDIGFDIDFSITGGLGRTQDFSGLVIPDLEVSGVNQPLLQNERRNVDFNFPDSWKVLGNYLDLSSKASSIEISGDQIDVTPWIRVESPDGKTHTIGVVVPVLTWSLGYRGEEPIVSDRELIQETNQLSKLQSLVLHNIHKRAPRLLIRVGSPESDNARVQPGVARGKDARYDLRSIGEPTDEHETFLCVAWESSPLVLASFRKHNATIPRRMNSVNQKDLLDAVLRSNRFFSLEDWQSFQAKDRAQSDEIKARAQSDEIKARARRIGRIV